MKRFKNLLVVINPAEQQQPALERACTLAQRTNAKITALLTIFDYSYEMTSILSGEEREAMRDAVLQEQQAWLKDVIAHIKAPCQVDLKLIWHNRPYEAIIKQAIQHNFDMIIKGTHQHDKLSSVIFTPTDWHLLRKSPVPVLLVKDHEWPVGGKVLAAVNVAAEDGAHQQLNKQILDTGTSLARELEGHLHMVNGYPSTPVNIAIELPDFDPHAYNQAIKNQHQNAVVELAQEHDIDLENCHLKEGLAEDVIPELAQQIDAELVILGTVGRTGFSAALIGNTAEHVIDNLNCDLLALKPEGYVSPLA
ncbi:universal stress protein UspE [Paraferrimonas sp. SM1919]|uniref:universal stress protein UspE n=1 Tax=Paraferrimonas sp. SM1919 TaxID=2662263 RepID=UPI0013D5C9CD|nr:universal stress protein UspE [Paraferrimonas sp. SM1919]